MAFVNRVHRLLVAALLVAELTNALHVAPSRSSLRARDAAPRGLRMSLDAEPPRAAGAGRRPLLKSLAAASAASLAAPAAAALGPESEYPLWLALPVAPYSRRKTIRRDLGRGVWTFDQMIGIYYVHVPIRMTVVKLRRGGLFVYAPVAATDECLALLKELTDAHGPVRHIVLPSVAVEHKVLAGPFARKFPAATFHVCDQQYSFPVPLPNAFLGLPPWTRPLPRSSEDGNPFGDDFDFDVLTVKPGPGSYYQDATFVHKPSKTVLLCDALFATTEAPPPILESDPEYVRALLFHARDGPLERVADTPENRRKGWRRIVLLFNFFFPGAATPDLGLKPLLALGPFEPYGWRGWKPFEWKSEAKERRAFEAFAQNGKPTILPIIQIILARGDSGAATAAWVSRVSTWSFDRVVPQHLDAPVNVGPAGFKETFANVGNTRFCDEDVAFLKAAEEGPLKFSVYPSKLTPLRGRGKCDLNEGLFT